VQPLHLGRIIGHQNHAFYLEVLKHVGGCVVFARIVGQAEKTVGVHRVGAVGLQIICTNFVRQADSTAFLAEVKNGTGATANNFGQRYIELFFAIALERAKNFARHTLRVDAHQDGRAAGNVAVNERNVLLHQSTAGIGGLVRCPEHMGFVKTETRWQVGRRDPFSVRPDHPGDVHLIFS